MPAGVSFTGSSSRRRASRGYGSSRKPGSKGAQPSQGSSAIALASASASAARVDMARRLVASRTRINAGRGAPSQLLDDSLRDRRGELLEPADLIQAGEGAGRPGS